MAVYIMRAGFDGPVKIGYTNNINLRRRNFQTASKEEIRVIVEIDGGPELERWLHWRFGDRRLRGEWFEFDNAMLTIQSELENADLSVPLVPRPKVLVAQATMPETPEFDLERVATAYGSLKALARRLNLTHSTVYCWRYNGGVPRWRQAEITEAMRHDGILHSEAA